METKERKERVILFAAEVGNVNAEVSLQELSDLASTAGAETVGILIQSREAIHPGTYIGKGKIEELFELVERLHADACICDDELSPAQMKNLQDLLPCKVIDRTVLILDIFAKRAVTAEGKIQVEMAQLKYSMTRLAGYGKEMSRLGGGIGTRGPGETKIETDRRRIRDRVSQLRRELEEVERHRTVVRQKRMKNHAPVAAIVGYTNAGKSTLLNYLTNAGVLSEDQLFATLDPTTRALSLPSKKTVLLTDTVGFISKLPHHLIEAFKSTLEEAKYADVIIHVLDATSDEKERNMTTVYQALSDLKVEGKPVITLFNKCDKLEIPDFYGRDPKAEKTFHVSAVTGEGLDDFLHYLDDVLDRNMKYIEKLYPFSEAGKVSYFHSVGTILEETYTEEGIHIKAYLPRHIED